MAQTWPLYDPNNVTFNDNLLFGLHDSPVKILAMALIWPKHGPNMVLLIGNNIDMSLGPISLNPESFISLVCLES